MTQAACAVFYQEKTKQAEGVFAERYAAIMAVATTPLFDWAADCQPELYRTCRVAFVELEHLWADGKFGEVFKKHVLTYFRTYLEICRLYAADLERMAA